MLVSLVIVRKQGYFISESLKLLAVDISLSGLRQRDVVLAQEADQEVVKRLGILR